jgi:hypothetical protein
MDGFHGKQGKISNIKEKPSQSNPSKEELELNHDAS